MDEAPISKVSTRFTLLFLGAVTAWLLILRPGQLAPDGRNADLHLYISLVALYALYFSSWRTHGIVFAIAAAFIFLLSDRPRPDHPEVSAWQLGQVFFLTGLCCHLIAWSDLENRTFSKPFWILMIFCIFGLAALIWVEAQQSASYLMAHPTEGWTVADQRMRICSFVLIVGGSVFGFALARQKSAAAWLWLAAGIAAPFAGYGIANLYVPLRSEYVLEGARWDRFYSDVNAWFARPDLFRTIEGWMWTSSWAVVPLMAVGLWRAVGRGFRQRKKGAAPLAWLLVFAALLLLAALLPVSSEVLRPVGLLWLGIALSVFAVADLALLLYEQLALPAPETGPSDVPRVDSMPS